MCVYAVEAIIYFQREIQNENIRMISLHGGDRGKRILAAEETRRL